jgi:hypothetical protein
MRFGVLIAAALLLFSVSAKADSTTLVDVTASTCQLCLTPETYPEITVAAQFTVTPVTGTFFNSGSNYIFTGPVLEVTNIAGTIDGEAMTLAAAAQGDGSWVYQCGANFCLGSVYFTANGSFSWFENDTEYNFVEITDANGDGYGESIPIQWSATADTPESSTLLSLGLGITVLLAFAVCRRFDLTLKPHRCESHA